MCFAVLLDTLQYCVQYADTLLLASTTNVHGLLQAWRVSSSEFAECRVLLDDNHRGCGWWNKLKGLPVSPQPFFRTFHRGR